MESITMSHEKDQNVISCKGVLDSGSDASHPLTKQIDNEPQA